MRVRFILENEGSTLPPFHIISRFGFFVHLFYYVSRHILYLNT
jgi:hypothetical protein